MYSLDDLKELGVAKGWCPYFLTRHLIHHASILVYNYQYMLDPKVANLVSRDLEAESIVVFDEAHNIGQAFFLSSGDSDSAHLVEVTVSLRLCLVDNVCIEALSVTLDRRMLDASGRSVNKLQSKVMEMKASDSARLVNDRD